MGRLYADENVPWPVKVELRRYGHDVITAQEAGQSGYADPDILAFATSEGRVLITLNRRHFARLHQEQQGRHSGIVLCSFDPAFESQALRIDVALQEGGDLTGRLLRILRS